MAQMGLDVIDRLIIERAGGSYDADNGYWIFENKIY
jgi:hypothetical protein